MILRNLSLTLLLSLLLWGTNGPCLFSAGAADAPSDPKSDQAKTDATSALNLFEISAPFEAKNDIDRILIPFWKEKGVEPANPCSDVVFLRRVYLDVIGTQPTEVEARAFFKDQNPNKRAVLIDQLLARPEFVDYWTMRWCDLLRVKSEFPINLWPHGAATYYRWIQESLRTNKPYDQFARELLLGQGSAFRSPTANFYRAVERKQPDTLAEAVALTFMGTRTDRWTDEQRQNFTVFFSRMAYKATAQWKEEIVYVDRTPLESPDVTFPDGSKGKVEPGTDPREAFVGWLVRPDNRDFNNNIVNRIWFWLTGQGIVNQPDDFRADNPPVCPALLDRLSKELVDSRYDLKSVYRLILNSGAYQLSSKAKGEDEQTARTNLAVYPVRRIDAEALQDILIKIFDLSITYVSEVPEPFAYLPPRIRTILLQDSGITNSFLEMFGRSTRDSGMLTDRNNDVNESQQLFMMNSTEINTWVNKITDQNFKKTKGLKDKAFNDKVNAIADTLWLTILSRFPSDAERTLFNKTFRSKDSRDIVWCLINTAEFMCRH